MQIPPSVVETLRRVCEKYPWPVVQEGRHLGEILNLVAWLHREHKDESGKILMFGLSRKTGGQLVDSPVGTIAEDILQLPDGHHWDVLGGAREGKPLLPGGGESIGIIDLRARPWVEPVEFWPEWYTGDPTPGPLEPPSEPTPVACKCDCQATPCNATPCLVDGSIKDIYALIANVLIAVHVDELVKRLDRIEGVVNELKGRPGCRLRW